MLSEQEDEALPLKSELSSAFPQSANINKSIVIENPQDMKRPPLLSPLSLDISDSQPSEKPTITRRTNSMRRDPPKMLVNRVPPAGIG